MNRCNCDTCKNFGWFRRLFYRNIGVIGDSCVLSRRINFNFPKFQILGDRIEVARYYDAKPERSERDILADRVHELVNLIFRKTKNGYCWIDGKFGNASNWRYDEEKLKNIILCLESKFYQTICPYHQRIHDSKKRTRL